MDIFRKYDETNLHTIEDYIREGQEENLFLDFKLLADPTLSKRDDRKSLAIALSGFANSEGGIIVWGVDARKNPEGVDVACDRKEIENLSLLLSRLNQYTGDAVDPLLGGVLHKKIPSSGDRGFAATVVPLSDSGPHMAKLGENRYYKRSGDSFYIMEHFDIEDMFGRRKKPKLLFTTKILSRSDLNFRVIVALENIGRGVAKSPFLEINLNSPYKIADFGLDGNGSFGLTALPPSLGSTSYKYGASSKVIHPGIVHDVTAVSLNRERVQEFREVPDLVINYKIAAEDMRMVESTKTIPTKDLLA
ncbi:MAG: ATP-binding protein [Deltaproteobacteria bacterium]|nr:ATP-binding protein [Deltaproteobacteria bacterium]